MTIKIPVEADVGQVQKSVQDLAKVIDRANRSKWNPVDLQKIATDIKQAERLLNNFRWRTGTMPHSGRSYGDIKDDVRGAARTSEPTPSGRGRSRSRNATSPDVFDIGRNLASGFGDPIGSIAGYSARGAISGNASGGFGGGALGLLKGLGIGTLAAGAFKAGQAVMEGYDLSKDRALTLDSLKRQMGDLGVSFNVLKAASEGASESIGMNSKETARLMEEFNRLSHGADKTEEGLAGSVSSSGRFARAYGMDPSQSVGFFAGMKNMNSRQSNKELALMIAESMHLSGMGGKPDELMAAIQQFASASSRMSLSMPNMSAYAGAYSELVAHGTPGLTPEVSAGILSSANSSIMRMGGAGEAGQAFIMAALNRNGALNPIQSAALSQGGLFGSRSGVFDSEGEISKFMGGGLGGLMGKNSQQTNFEAIRGHLSRMGGSKWFQLEGAQRLFGLNSLSNAAAMMNLSGIQANGLQRSLRTAGVDINSLNESGLQSLARIGGASSKDELNSLFSDMKRRTGAGALTKGERSQLETAQGGTFDEFKNAMIKIAATKDQAETDASKMRDSIARVETREIELGDKLITPLNTMRDVLLATSGYSKRTLAEKIHGMNVKDINDDSDSDIAAAKAANKLKKDSLWKSFYDSPGTSPGNLTGRFESSRALEIEMGGIRLQEDSQIKTINRERARRLQQLDEQEKSALGITSGSNPDAIAGLPAGATTSRGGAKDHLEVTANVNVRSSDEHGRMVSHSAGSSRVSVPRGSGQSSVSVDVR